MTGTRKLASVAVGLLLAAAACTGGNGGGTPPSTTVPLPPLPDADSTTTTAAPPPPSPAGATLLEVQRRGLVRCGVAPNQPGFTDVVDEQVVGGFDVDFCRALAVAIFGEASRVAFVILSATDRWSALDNGDIDVLFRNTTWTSERDIARGFDFGPTVFHDGQQLMAPAADGFSAASSISDLLGATVCVNEGTTSEDRIREAVGDLGVEVTIRPVGGVDVAVDGLVSGTCGAITADGSAIAGFKRLREPNPDAWVVFPSRPISYEPLGPVYRSNDSQWADIVNWTVYATMIADDKGVDSSNVRRLLTDSDLPDMESRVLLGEEGRFGVDLGLRADAFLLVIEQVGNYSEIFSRNLNPLGMTREGTLNASVENFGLIQAPPVRSSE